MILLDIIYKPRCAPSRFFQFLINFEPHISEDTSECIILEAHAFALKDHIQILCNFEIKT